MTQSLVVTIQDGESITYGYEHGLKAVCEALQKELGTDFDKLEFDVVEDYSWTIGRESS